MSRGGGGVTSLGQSPKKYHFLLLPLPKSPKPCTESFIWNPFFSNFMVICKGLNWKCLGFLGGNSLWAPTTNTKNNIIISGQREWCKSGVSLIVSLCDLLASRLETLLPPTPPHTTPNLLFYSSCLDC